MQANELTASSGANPPSHQRLAGHPTSRRLFPHYPAHVTACLSELASQKESWPHHIIPSVKGGGYHPAPTPELVPPHRPLKMT